MRAGGPIRAPRPTNDRTGESETRAYKCKTTRLSEFAATGHSHMLNHGVTQTYLIVKIRRSKIFTGSENMKIRNVYMVMS